MVESASEERVASHDKSARSTGRLDLCFRATALLLICYGPPQWYLRGSCWLLMGICLLHDGWRHRWWLWAATAAVLLLGVYLHWTTADNHKYLMAYWCVALSCSCLQADRKWEVLNVNATLLIGLVMLLGAGWKLASSDYRAGHFFEFTLLTDDRFVPLVSTVTDLTREDVQRNAESINRMATGYVSNENPRMIDLRFTAGVRYLALAITWWTVAIESLCAAVFLMPLRRHIRIRHAVLITFAATTYAIAPIAGFGGLLMVMAMAMTAESHWRLFRVYMLLFLFVLVAPVFVGPLLQSLTG